MRIMPPGAQPLQNRHDANDGITEHHRQPMPFKRTLGTGGNHQCTRHLHKYRDAIRHIIVIKGGGEP